VIAAAAVWTVRGHSYKARVRALVLPTDINLRHVRAVGPKVAARALVRVDNAGRVAIGLSARAARFNVSLDGVDRHVVHAL
jgi:hypothetical protein